MFRNLTFLALLFLSLIILNNCGQQGTGGGTCVPNVIDNGLSLSVTSIGNNVYTFELCAASNPVSAVYSVYGGLSPSSVAQGSFNVNAALRSGHVAQGNQAGSVFQATFQGSDVYFAIFQDTFSGGAYQLDNSTTPMVSAHRLPGR